jgi:hypothetical protein
MWQRNVATKDWKERERKKNKKKNRKKWAGSPVATASNLILHSKENGPC